MKNLFLFFVLITCLLQTACSPKNIEGPEPNKNSNFRYCSSSTHLQEYVIEEGILEKINTHSHSTEHENPVFEYIYGTDNNGDELLVVLFCKEDGVINLFDIYNISTTISKEQVISIVEEKGYTIENPEEQISLIPYNGSALVWYVSISPEELIRHNEIDHHFYVDFIKGHIISEHKVNSNE